SGQLYLETPRLFSYNAAEEDGIANLEPEPEGEVRIIDNRDTLFVSSPYLDAFGSSMSPLSIPTIKFVSEQAIPTSDKLANLSSPLELPDFAYKYKNFAIVEYRDLEGRQAKAFDPMVSSRFFGLRRR